MMTRLWIGSAVIEDGEQILVYGDCDADGMIGCFYHEGNLWSRWGGSSGYLSIVLLMGMVPMPVSTSTLSNSRDFPIITVDNGEAGREAIDLAQSMGG